MSSLSMHLQMWRARKQKVTEPMKRSMVISLTVLLCISITYTIYWIIHEFNISVYSYSPELTTNLRNNSLANISVIDTLIMKLKVKPWNPVYRVGDILFHRGYRWRSDADTIKYNLSWNGTILHKYLHLQSVQYQNFNKRLFDEAIDWYIENLNKALYIPSDKELLLHIRAGDKMEYAKKYNQDRTIFLIHKAIKIYNITKVTFLCVINFSPYLKINKFIYSKEQEIKNKNNLKQLFERIYDKFQHKITCFNLISNELADDDIVIAMMAKYLFVDVKCSGYARLLSVLNPIAYDNIAGLLVQF